MTILIEFTISEICAMVSSSAAILGGLLALCQWRKSISTKRADYLNELTGKIRSDPDIKEAFYLIEYDEPWYSLEFHEGGELESKMDKMLSYFSYICYLKKRKIIGKREFDYFKYEIERIVHNTDIIDYFYNLYHFSRSVGTPFTYQYIFEYGKSIGAFDKDFFDPASWKKIDSKYHGYLNF